MNIESIKSFLSRPHYEHGGYVHTARRRFRFTHRWRLLNIEDKTFFDTGAPHTPPINTKHIRAFSLTHKKPSPTIPLPPPNPKPLIH